MKSFKVTLMPLNYNGLDLLKLAVPKLIEASEASIHDIDIVIVDNNSKDESELWLKTHYPKVTFLAYKENKILIPEINNGQLITLIRDQYLVDAQPLNKIKGVPFESREIKEAILNMLKQ